MDKSSFIHIIDNPESIQQKQTVELKSIINSYPYFQSARALYLKALKKQESFKYNSELKTTAAYTQDRTVLFDFITSKKLDFNTNIAPIKENVKTKETGLEEELEIGKPIQFTSNDTYSFNEWLQLGSYKPIVRNEEEKPVEEKSRLIDRFIKSNPKITPVDKNTVVETKVKEQTDSNALMTETLAKVYLEQKKYDNAIKAYQILSLKYPEKSGFFADQIKRIQILQKHKS